MDIIIKYGFSIKAFTQKEAKIEPENLNWS